MRISIRVLCFSGLVIVGLSAYAQINLPFGKTKEPERLSKEDISAALVLKKGDFDKCREEHKKKEPTVSGKLLMRFAVEPSGKTTDITLVSTEFKNTTFDNCLSDAVKGWTFQKAKQKSAAYDLLQTF